MRNFSSLLRTAAMGLLIGSAMSVSAQLPSSLSKGTTAVAVAAKSKNIPVNPVQRRIGQARIAKMVRLSASNVTHF
ncbi:MAG: hypothetical protein PUD15_06820 [Prevotella sp.]|nr:hypothetical protein [Prevotella sp.]